MGKLNMKQRLFLQDKFGNRANFNRVERMLYGHDIAAIPTLIKPFIGNIVPSAVVQPTNENELVDLVVWAHKNRIALTPRGKATSGYGGVLPVHQGVVVDFYRMNKVISVDPLSMMATVQAGVMWEKLEKKINKQGLTLKLYPSSYPGSTVGGWLAQGGAGIGSYEFGWFKDNVVGARAVLPDGTVRDFQGSDIDLISDAEGITGLISEITIRLQQKEELEVIAIGCPDASELQRFLQSAIDNNVPLWSVIFINPRMAELKNRAPLTEHNGHPVEERVLLPASYIAIMTCKANVAVQVRKVLPGLLKPCQGEILSDRIAQHEWKNRFKIMVVKRLGPSLVPAEVVIPLSSLGATMEEIENTVHQPVVKEGVIIKDGAGGKPEVVILGFIPSDQRKFSYNFVFSLSLTIMKIAVKYGGRPYATGLYYTGKAASILGKDRLDKIKKFKSTIDHRKVLNPGKVYGGKLIGVLLNIATFFEPAIRPFGNRIITKVGERPRTAIKSIPSDVAWYAYSCSQCGYCVEECDQFYGRGWESQSPRGRWYWLREYMEGREKWNQFMVDSFIACTTCEMCNTRCSASLPIESSWMKLRGKLIHEDKRMTIPPFEMMAAALTAEGDIWAGYRKDRDTWFPSDLVDKHGPSHKASSVYFAGCTASYVEQDIAMASVRLLDAAGVDFSYLGKVENCCGTPMLVAGKWDVFAEVMKKNIKAVQAAGADTVITSCPACDMMWRHVYPKWAEKLGIDYRIQSKHYSEVLADRIRNGKFAFPPNRLKPFTVTWNESSHNGRV